MAAFDAAAVRAQLAELEGRIAALEASRGEDAGEGDEDEILDLICEANEMRDQLRNHESFPALWAGALGKVEASADPQLTAAGPVADRNTCAVISGVLSAEECAALRGAAAAGAGFAPDVDGAWAAEGKFRGDVAARPGLIRRSDDVELSQVLWRRVAAVVPQRLDHVVAPAAEAKLRTEMWKEFPWDATWEPVTVDARVVYEQAQATDPATAPRLDTTDADDRDEGWRPLVTLLLCLGAGDAGGGAVEVELVGQAEEAGVQGGGGGGAGPPTTLTLRQGEAAVFVRGEARHAYALRSEGAAAVAHCKVLYATAQMRADAAMAAAASGAGAVA